MEYIKKNTVKGVLKRAILGVQQKTSLWPYRYFAAFALLLYIFAASLSLARYQGNPTALFHFGHFYIKQNPQLTPPGSIRFIGNEPYGGNGYDGQIFFYYARSLFQKGAWPQGFSMAYRAPRIGLPLLTAPFNVFGPWGLVFGFYVVQMGLILLALQCLYKILKKDNRYLLLFFVASPFMLRSALLMVSDITALCLSLIGYFFWRKLDKKDVSVPKNIFISSLSFIFFSLAIFAKESALFFLFPLGLWAIFGDEPAFWKATSALQKQKRGAAKNRTEEISEQKFRSIPKIPNNFLEILFPNLNIKKALVLLFALVPMLAWQYYLQRVHGMVPANILKIFLSPFQGILGLGLEILAILQNSPSPKAALLLLAKASARVLLVFLLIAAIFAALRAPFRQGWPFRLMAFLTALSIIFADHFYFWGIFDNIARMFVMLMPALVLLSDAFAPPGDTRKKTEKHATYFAADLPFFLGSLFLTLLLLFRSAFLSPTFPFDTWRPYNGPSYPTDPASPFCKKNAARIPKICRN